MASNSALILVSEHDEAGWKESSRTISLELRESQVVLTDRSSGDNPYQSESWDNQESWAVEVNQLIRLIKQHGKKLSE